MCAPSKLMSTFILGAVISASSAMAAVSPDEAEALKTTLTPFGAERAGNADGTIPAWEGAYTTPIPGDAPGGRRGDPFADEKPLFSITTENMAQYAEKLSDGTQAMLRKYPDSYRLDVYPTHRTAGAPQWVYDKTYENALNGKMVGDIPENVYGGIPFPIPQSGAEVMWNHLLRWRGVSFSYEATQYLLTSKGQQILLTRSTGNAQMPYYYEEGSWDDFSKSQEFWIYRVNTQAPPRRAGEALALRFNLNGDNDRGWTYLQGQRRVRRVPNPCCDSPNPQSGGLGTYDETQVWNGRIDRFDWELVGKKELYVPYNVNRLLGPKDATEVLDKHHVKPEYMRWELHRVWVVDATLRAGQRHLAKKMRYYCDEDTWTCLLADRWDENGELWKTLYYANAVMPDLPGTVGIHFGLNDMLSGNAFMSGFVNDFSTHYQIKDRIDDGYFTPAALAGEGIR